MPGMTPKRQPQRGSSPQRFTPRASSKMPGSVRRALDGQILSSQRNDESLGVEKGRLGVRLAAGGGLKATSKGIMLDPTAAAASTPPIKRQSDLATTATNAQIATAFNDLLAALRKTGRMQ